MSQRYDVDDILEEIRRKRTEQPDSEPPRRSAPPRQRREEAAPRTQSRRTQGGFQPQELPEEDEPVVRQARQGTGARPKGSAPISSGRGRMRPEPEEQLRKASEPTKRFSESGWEMTAEIEKPKRAPRRGTTARSPEERPPAAQAKGRGAGRPAERYAAAQEDDFYEEEAPRGARQSSPPARADESGFNFQAQGVGRPPRDDFGFVGAPPSLSGDSEEFSLHFDLDEPTADLPNLGGETGELGALFLDTQELEQPPERGGPPPEKSKWNSSYRAQEELEEADPEDEFSSMEDVPAVTRELKSMQTGLWVRLGIVLVLFCASLYLTLAARPLPFAELLGLEKDFLLDVPTFMISAQDSSKLNIPIFLISNLVVFLGAAIAACNVVGAGFMSFCRMHATSDSPAALATLGVMVQGIVLIFMDTELETSDKISLYFPLAIAVLLFTLIGKLMLASRVRRNFKALAEEERDRFALLHIRDRDFAREFSRGIGPDASRVAYSAPAGFFASFLDRSYCGDYSDNFSCVAAPFSLVGGALAAGGTYLLSQDLGVSVSVFAAVLCICAPFSSAIVPNLMLGRLSKWLTKRGCMIAGYETAEEYTDTDAIILSDKDLFAESSVTLHGMKVFAEKRIDEAILDAASVVIGCKSILSGVFLNMIGGNRRMLKKVDSPVYEDGMGISAWVGGKRVLIGSRELMLGHEIECPSAELEARYMRDGRKVLYISNSGELSAMFVLSYNAEQKISDYLVELQRRGIGIVLYSTDPNITGELIAQNFGIRKKNVRVLPAKLHPEYQYLVRPKERVTVGGAHPGGLPGLLMLLRASASIRRSVRVGAVVQLIGSIVGYGLVALMAFTDSMALATCTTLLLFLLAWLVVTTTAASIGKG